MATRGKGIRSSAQDNFIAPDAPTGVSATDVGTSRAFNNGAATVTFTAPTTGNTVGITSYTATSSPGGYTASGASSPLTVTGLQSNTSYTFTVTATNAYGTSSASSASASITATTVPATPSAPTISSVSNQATDVVTWTAPATGGKAITGYTWSSSDGKSGSTASTSVNVAQEAGTAQTYNVYATNANGNSGTSANSTSFTSFSFTPFSFVPYSFTPYAFTPYGFVPYGFVPYSFTPYAFTPFFWLDGGNALAPEIGVRSNSSEDGIIDIRSIEVGNVLTARNPEDGSFVDTIVTSVETFDQDQAIMIDGEVFSINHKVLVRKGQVESFVSVTEIDTTYQKYSYIQEDFVDIFSVENVEIPISSVSITCAPYNNFLTNDVVLSD
jgi:hypothetical protein